MKILFELLTPQSFIGGGAEYVRKVFYTLLDHISNNNIDVNVVALIDSSIGKYAYQDLTSESLSKKGVEVADLNGRNINNIIEQLQIDRFFFGCAQYLGRYKDVADINIPGTIVIHDLCSEEYSSSQVTEIPNLPYSWYGYNRMRAGLFKRKLLGQWRDSLVDMQTIMTLAERNKNVQLVTVSEYSKSSLAFNFSYPVEKIHVLYSCERISPKPNGFDDKVLEDIVSSGKTYYLMLSANRDMKNPKNAFAAFNRFVEYGHKDTYLVTTGCKQKQFENHVPLNYLSDNDLVQVMSNCYALLFPSFFEGFGYPPVEAMGYGKPVLSSNVTSMPDILGDAPIYFSPLYPTDIFRALNVLTDENYHVYSNRSKEQSKIISTRQKQDLSTLIQLIIKKFN